ncbi:hypothetical protein ABZ016_17775 [Streptomyces sp. NPDC006372]
MALDDGTRAGVIPLAEVAGQSETFSTPGRRRDAQGSDQYLLLVER